MKSDATVSLPNSPKLTLGTAILDDKYGITRSSNKYNDKEKIEFLHKAISLGVSQFDTAPSYGTAESLIGMSMKQNEMMRISTKISESSCRSKNLLLASIEKSLTRLGRVSLDATLIHNSSVLRGKLSNEIYAGCIEAMESGKVRGIGVSVYSEDELLWVKKHFPKFTVFQIPSSVLGRQSQRSTKLMELHEQGNWLEVRSIFLQGVLLADLKLLPSYFSLAHHIFLQFQEICASKNISALEACIAYSKSIPWASAVVVGVENDEQLCEVINAFGKEWEIDFSNFPILPETYQDPRNWTLTD